MLIFYPYISMCIQGLLQNVQFIFDIPLEDVLESRGCELANTGIVFNAFLLYIL